MLKIRIHVLREKESQKLIDTVFGPNGAKEIRETDRYRAIVYEMDAKEEAREIGMWGYEIERE